MSPRMQGFNWAAKVEANARPMSLKQKIAEYRRLKHLYSPAMQLKIEAKLGLR